MKKLLVLISLFLFLGVSILPSTIGFLKENYVLMNLGSRGYIQGLIDNASDGETIYISSGIYYECIVINKRISLVGEDKNTTIIDGSNIGDVVTISADWVNISGFTIQNGTSGWYHAGIYLNSNNTAINNNIIMNNQGNGIITNYSDYSSKYNIIINNTIKGNMGGILFSGSHYSTITGNIISDNLDYGINFGVESYNNIIENNSKLDAKI